VRHGHRQTDGTLIDRWARITGRPSAGSPSKLGNSRFEFTRFADSDSRRTHAL